MADNKLNGKPCSLLQLGFDSPDILRRKEQGGVHETKKPKQRTAWAS
jgi:hypothetical protein